MDTPTLKDAAIKKLSGLPIEEIEKVLIFMEGLDAGMHISNQECDSKNER